MRHWWREWLDGCTLLGLWYGYCYRAVMRTAHKFNWHYAPAIHPEGDTMLWCKWCGMRYVVPRSKGPLLKSPTPSAEDRAV